MAQMRPLLETPVLVGVGAAFDFHAGLVPQAPPWMQQAGLEWAYRLTREPRRLWRRYLRYNPRFVGAFALQLNREAEADRAIIAACRSGARRNARIGARRGESSSASQHGASEALARWRAWRTPPTTSRSSSPIAPPDLRAHRAGRLVLLTRWTVLADRLARRRCGGGVLRQPRGDGVGDASGRARRGMSLTDAAARVRARSLRLRPRLGVTGPCTYVRRPRSSLPELRCEAAFAERCLATGCVTCSPTTCSSAHRPRRPHVGDDAGRTAAASRAPRARGPVGRRRRTDPVATDDWPSCALSRSSPRARTGNVVAAVPTAREAADLERAGGPRACAWPRGGADVSRPSARPRRPVPDTLARSSSCGAPNRTIRRSALRTCGSASLARVRSSRGRGESKIEYVLLGARALQAPPAGASRLRARGRSRRPPIACRRRRRPCRRPVARAVRISAGQRLPSQRPFALRCSRAVAAGRAADARLGCVWHDRQVGAARTAS